MRSAWSLSLLIGVVAIAQPAWADDRPPVIKHTPIVSATSGSQVTVVAQITDESEVFQPSLTFRAVGSSSKKTVSMIARKGVGKAEYFEANINLDSSVEYWIEVYDEFGNGPATSGSPDRPHVIEAVAPVVVERAAPKPKPVKKEEEQDLSPPVIIHTPMAEVTGPAPYTVSATITDPSGVFAPTVYHRPVGETTYASAAMEKDADTYSASLNLTPPFEYWMEAYDNFGNGPSLNGSADAPYRVKLGRDELPAAAIAFDLPQDEFDAPREGSKKWWLVGGASVVGAAIIGGVVYALASQPDYGAWIVTQAPARRR